MSHHEDWKCRGKFPRIHTLGTRRCQVFNFTLRPFYLYLWIRCWAVHSAELLLWKSHILLLLLGIEPRCFGRQAHSSSLYPLNYLGSWLHQPAPFIFSLRLTYVELLTCCISSALPIKMAARSKARSDTGTVGSNLIRSTDICVYSVLVLSCVGMGLMISRSPCLRSPTDCL
jgi:hypothetical protein